MFRRAELSAWAAGYRTRILVAVALLLLVLGLAALDGLTREIRLADVRNAFHAIEPARVAAALALTGASYLALTFYDVLALRVIGRPLPWRTAALASFTSYTLSHNLGLAPVTGGSARYRVYSEAGLDMVDVARVVAIAGATFWAGVVAVTGAALLLHRGAVSMAGVTLSPAAAHAAGAAAIAAVAGLVASRAFGLSRLSLWGWSIPLPAPSQALAQIGIAGVDVAAAGTALFVLVPGTDPHLLPNFMLAYALGIVLALVSHVPGGVGVFEATVLAIAPGDRASVLAALAAYRVIYYLLPLGLGVTLMAVREGRAHRGRAGRMLSGTRAVATGLAPAALAAACFMGGVLLLVSGSLPAIPARLRFLHDIVPLPFIEASHIAASLAGTGLLLIAPGLYRRLDGAFVVARALLLAAAAFSLAKGLDYEEAAVCLALAAALQWTRPAFYRRTALLGQPLAPTWLLSVAGVLALSLWVGFFSYRHVPYHDDLWWRIALHADASRFLRASLAVAVLLAGLGLWRLLSPAAVRLRAPAAEDLRDVQRLLAEADRTDAMLALAGDKRFLFSPARDAFLMYAVRGASWIVMGDPVGNPGAWPELLWSVRTAADAAQGRLLLYQIGSGVLEPAIGMGLAIVKYGEEALVDLSSFDLDTPRLRSLRRAERRAAKAGAVLEVVPADAVPPLLGELRAVSDEWLRGKGHGEKRFSLGRFDGDYLSRFPCALVRVDGRIVAFANIWTASAGGELSIDMMRHRDDAPPGTMDFLFAGLFAWGKEQGYARFSLGLAPLSGIEARRLAPVWARVAGFVFRHGERLYGFRGLRAYKEKFSPHWEPRYIAGPHGVGMVLALRDLGRLVNDGGREPDAPPSRPRRPITPPAPLPGYV